MTFSVQHYGEYHKVVFSVYAPFEPLEAICDDIHPSIEPCEPEKPKELVTLSYVEAKLLKALLNRPEVTALLDQE